MELLVTDDPPLGHSVPQPRFEHKASSVDIYQSNNLHGSSFYIHNKKGTHFLAKHYIDDETDEESLSTPKSLINQSECPKGKNSEFVAITDWPFWTEDNRRFGFSSDVL